MSQAHGAVTIALVDALPRRCGHAAVWRRPKGKPSEIILLSVRLSDHAGAVLDTAILRMMRLRRLAGSKSQYEQFECVEDATDVTSLEEPFLSATLKINEEYLRLIQQIQRAPKQQMVGLSNVQVGTIAF